MYFNIFYYNMKLPSYTYAPNNHVILVHLQAITIYKNSYFINNQKHIYTNEEVHFLLY